MERRSESFGRMLKAGMAGIAHIEGKRQDAVEAELGALIGVAGVTLQRYKTGHLPPDPQSIERLAEACVRRGLLGRLWLERFLEAAQQPLAIIEALSARLFPQQLVQRERVPRLNLPPPTYTRFIMRKAAYDGLMAGLRSDLPVTLLLSLGGMGKTSLARAVTAACLEAHKSQAEKAASAQGAQHSASASQSPSLPVPFAVAVWVSDKDHFGTTNLSSTLDEIARVLDYPGLIERPFVERQREIANLLRERPVLLVIDNAETITDSALLEWLGRLPSPSKALVTSRFALPRLGPAYSVELTPMSAAETRALIADWLPRSRLHTLRGGLDQFAPIIEVAGGNPKATQLALGLLQHRSLTEVIEDVHIARGGLFDELFARAWALLDEAARRVLLALPLFPGSAAAEALGYCADLSAAAFAASVEQLDSLSLLDVERYELHVLPRYNAHPLVRAYAQARAAEQPPLAQLLRERWLSWCADTAHAVGFCWYDLDRLDALDSEYVAIQEAVRWAAAQQRDQEVIKLVEGVRYYYNVRGLWGEEELHNHERRAAAARRLGDRDNLILALAHRVEVLSKQGGPEHAAAALAELTALAEGLYREQRQLRATEYASGALVRPNLRDDAAFEYGHALGLHARASGDLAAAEAHWRDLLGLAQPLGGQKYVINRRWLATVLLEQGDSVAAQAYYREALADAEQINDTRSITGNRLKLAQIALAHGELRTADEALATCRTIAERYRDRRRLAEYHRLAGQIAAQQGRRAEALAELQVARDLFERQGMRREAAEVDRLSAEC
jgi:hypothetical protein